MSERQPTPREDGFSMPAEWEPHEACLMEWPTVTRRRFSGRTVRRGQARLRRGRQLDRGLRACRHGLRSRARRPRPAEPAGPVSRSSPFRSTTPGCATTARSSSGTTGGRVALVHFRFNAWGEKYLRTTGTPRSRGMSRRTSACDGIEAPFVLEGGSFFVDGEGTLITTEQCLLNPNRNPTMSRVEIERGPAGLPGHRSGVWLGLGHSTDRDTDGHIDGIASYVGPRSLPSSLRATRTTPITSVDGTTLTVSRRARDAKGRSFEVIPFQTRPSADASHISTSTCQTAALWCRSRGARKTSRRSSRSPSSSPNARSFRCRD